MAVIRRIESQRSFDIGGIPSTQVDDSVGQGLRAVGGAIQNAGEAMHAMEMRRLQSQMQMVEFGQTEAFNRWQNDNALEFGKAQDEMSASGDGFTGNVSKVFTDRSEEFLKNVPDALKPKFSELVSTARETWINKAAAAEVDQRNNWYRTGVTERQQILQNQVFDDPAMFDAAKEDAFRTIDSSGLPPVEKEALKKKTEEMFSLAVGEREVRDAEANPSSATGAASRLGVPAAGNDAVDVVVSKIIGVESGGRANAKNPNSSASGLGQFIDSTWLSTVKKYRPDIAQGRSNKEILSLKNDPQLGREMTKRYTQENAAELRKSGMPVNPGTLYLAHFAGIGGAKAVLRSADDASLANVLGPAVIKANGFLSGKSAGWLKDWAAKKMGDAKGVPASTGAAPADPRYANLSLMQRLSIYDNIQAAAQRGETAIRAQEKAQYDAQKGALQLGIQTGEVASPQQILSSPMSDADKATLLSALRSRQGDAALTQQALADFQNGSLKVDPYSSDGKKTVDAVQDVISKNVPAEQQQYATENLVAQTGVVPQSVLNRMRAGLESTNVSEVEAAAQEAARIAQINPAALSRRDGGSEVQKRADDFNHFVKNLNLTPAQAAQKIAEMNDPDKQRERKALEPAAKEFRKQLENDDLGSMFDESWLPFNDPNIGFTEGQRLGIQAEYLAIAEEQFYQANGNVELAKNRAAEEMKRLYGVTRMGSSATVIKHPPERYWPAESNSLDPHGYARDQIVSEIMPLISDEEALRFVGATQTGINQSSLDQTFLGKLPLADKGRERVDEAKRQMILGSLQIVATPETDQMIKSGKLPGYAVFYADGNGVLQTIPGKLFVPNIEPAMRAQEQSINWAQEDRETLLEDERAVQGPDGGRERTLDTFLDGDPLTGRQRLQNPPPNVNLQPPTQHQELNEQRQRLMDDARNSGILSPDGM